MSVGYANSPRVVASAPCFCDLSLNWVMRLASPKPVSVLRIHASCVCADTCDCTKSVETAGSMPAAMYCAAVRRVLARSAAGSCGTVIAWRSTTQNTASCVVCSSFHCRSAPM